MMVRVCGSNTGREGDGEGVREQHRERVSVTVRV